MDRYILFDFIVIAHILNFNLVAKLISQQPDRWLRAASDIECQAAKNNNQNTHNYYDYFH